MIPPLLTVDDVAILFCVSKETMRLWYRAGLLRLSTASTEQLYLFDREDVLGLLPEHIRHRDFTLLNAKMVLTRTGVGRSSLLKWVREGVLSGIRLPCVGVKQDNRYVLEELMAATRVPPECNRLTVAETAELLGISHSGVNNYIDAGLFKIVRYALDKPRSQQPVGSIGIRRYLVHQLYK